MRIIINIKILIVNTRKNSNSNLSISTSIICRLANTGCIIVHYY